MSEDNITRIYPEREPKKTWLRVLAAVLAVAAVTAIVVIVLLRGGVSLDGVRRFVRYLGVSRSDTDGRFVYDQHSSNAYAAAGDGLAVASVGGVTVFDKNGAERYTAARSFSAPAVQSGDSVTLAYDIGGTALLAIDHSRGVTADVTAGGTLLDADISSGGAVAYCAVEDGKKTVLTILDSKQQEIYKWYSSSSFLSPCAVSERGGQAAAIAAGQSEHAYESTLELFDTGSQDDPAAISLGNLLVYDLDYLTDSDLCAVGETEAVFAGTDGTLTGRYDYGGRYLKDYSLGGDGFLTLALNTYQAGSRYSVVTVDAGTLEAKELYLGIEVLSVSASGAYLAVLTVDGLNIYTQDLTLYAQQTDTGAATRVLQRSDGTALLISGNSASLFIP